MNTHRRYVQATTLWLALGVVAIFSLRVIGSSSGLTLATSIQTQPEMVFTSPSALTLDASAALIYVADETGSRLLQLDLTTSRVSRTIPMGAHPTGIALTKAGDRLYVTTDTPDDSVLVLDSKAGKVLSKISAGHAPRSPV